MGKYLDKISSPADLKKLPVAELPPLAEEIRQFILRSVSKAGGHLASNLGAVELTLALHYVFDFQRDKLLWDVGHQCYTHKIVTGRQAGFELLRHAGGVSGFPNPAESEYDQFTVGHAGTSIATAIGMALGEQLKAGTQKTEDGGQKADDGGTTCPLCHRARPQDRRCRRRCQHRQRHIVRRPEQPWLGQAADADRLERQFNGYRRHGRCGGEVSLQGPAEPYL